MGDLTPSLRNKVFLLLWHQRIGRCPFCANESALLMEREARLSDGRVLKDRICEPCRAGGHLPDVGEVQPLNRFAATGEPAPVEDAAVYLQRLKEQEEALTSERARRRREHEAAVKQFQDAHARLGDQLEKLDRYVAKKESGFWGHLVSELKSFWREVVRGESREK